MSSSQFFSGQKYEGWDIQKLSPGVYSFYRKEVMDGAPHNYYLPLPPHVFRNFTATILDAAGDLGTPLDFACNLYREIAGSNAWTLLSAAVYVQERDFCRQMCEGALAMSAGRYRILGTGAAAEILYLEFVADFGGRPGGGGGGGNLHTLQDGREAGLWGIYEVLDNMNDRAHGYLWTELVNVDNGVCTATKAAVLDKKHHLIGYLISYTQPHDFLGAVALGGVVAGSLVTDAVYHSCDILAGDNEDLAISIPASGTVGDLGYVMLVGYTQ